MTFYLPIRVRNDSYLGATCWVFLKQILWFSGFHKHFLRNPGVLPKFLKDRARERRQAGREAVLAEFWAFHGFSWNVSSVYTVASLQDSVCSKVCALQTLWQPVVPRCDRIWYTSLLAYGLKGCRYKPHPKSRSHWQRRTSFSLHLVCSKYPHFNVQLLFLSGIK